MDRMDEARTLIAVADAGTISGAARSLGVNKSVVSRRLSALEARLGVVLVNRSSRGLSLTDAGAAYRDRAAALLSDWAELEDGLRADRAALSGGIRIAAPLSFGLSQLAPVLLDFQRDHPDIRLDADFSDRVTDIVGEGFDLAVRIGSLPDSELRARRLGRAAMIAVAAPGWAEGKALLTVEDFDGLPELRYSLRGRSGMSVRLPSGRERILPTHEAMRSSSGDFLRDAAAAGLGVAVLPEFIVCDAVRAGALVTLLDDHGFAPLDIHAVHSATRHQPRRVGALIEYIAGAFGSGDAPPWAL